MGATLVGEALSGPLAGQPTSCPELPPENSRSRVWKMTPDRYSHPYADGIPEAFLVGPPYTTTSNHIHPKLLKSLWLFMVAGGYDARGGSSLREGSAENSGELHGYITR